MRWIFMKKNIIAMCATLLLMSGCSISPKVEPVDIGHAGIDAGIAVVSSAQYNLFALHQFDGDVPPGFKRRFRYYEGTNRPEEDRGSIPDIYSYLGDDFFVEQASKTLRKNGYKVVTPDQADYFLVYSDLGFRKTPTYGSGVGVAAVFVTAYTLGLLPPLCDDFAFTLQHSLYRAGELGNALDAEQNVHVTRNCLNPWAHGFFPSKESEDELEEIYANLIEKSIKSIQVNYVLY
ncbi:MAG: hypothetical protein ACJAV3_001006 [Alcanivorax sp.]|jgi:hypothetical protein